MNNSDFKKRIDNLSPGQRELLAGQLGDPKDHPGDYQGPRIVAYVAGEVNLSAAGLRTYLKGQLPDYMVPATFVILDQLPRLPNGKLDRSALPAPSETAAAPESSYAAPRTPMEQQLVDIWEEVLHFQPVGIHDNFFEIGGDSILSIQIVSKARKAGLSLGANQLFEHQTIAELALFIEPEKERSSKDELVTGPLPLTPIQHWFFEEFQAAPHHWNQEITCHLSPAVNAAMTKQAIQQLIRCHDALRLQFAPAGNGWQAVILEPEKMDSFQHFDLSSLPLPEQDRLIREKSAALQAAFRFSEGSLFQCVYFTCEPVQRNRLLLAAHHLLVDAVSWQILIEGLNTAFNQLSRGEKLSLPAKTNAFKEWSEFLAALAQAGKFREEYAFWQAQTQNASSLPADFEAKLPVPEESMATLNFELDEGATQALLKEATKAYRMRPEEILIAAFLQAAEEWGGLTTVTLGLERHGREPAGTDIDLSNTVGWFTAYFPLTFRLLPAADPGSTLKSVKEQLRQVPNGGIGYGILRYLDDRKPEAENLSCRPPVIFNYLGTQNPPASDLLSNVQMVFSGTRDPQSERYSLLEINALVLEGRLNMRWSYSRRLYRTDTVNRLIATFEKALRRLVSHCVARENSDYTPSDFPEADLSQEDLDHLLGQIDL